MGDLMEYFVKPARKKHKRTAVMLKIIVFLLVCTFALCVYGLFFYNNAYEASRELVRENTELKIRQRELERENEELRIKNEELEAEANRIPDIAEEE